MFSFWWDVEMDWGLALCQVDTWLGPSRARTENGDYMMGHRPPSPTGRRGVDHTLWSRARSLLRPSPHISHQRSPCPTPALNLSPVESPELGTSGRFFAFGLRPTLLLPDPLVYHLFALIDLVLRFTWSLKLSSHLHTIAEIESGVFMMEALELARRWMWVFVRVEWEAVKMGEVRRWTQRGDQRGQVLWADPVKDGVPRQVL